MPISQFSLLIQAAGTGLLLLLFLLLYQKIRRHAFIDWIASWAFLLVGLFMLFFQRAGAGGREIVFLLHASLLGHAVFLLLGVLRLRSSARGRGAWDILWLLPILFVAASFDQAPSAPSHAGQIELCLAAAYVAAAVTFAIGTGAAAGRFLLSVSFLLWGVLEAIQGSAQMRLESPAPLPGLLQYAGFAGMLIEMMIAVGVILLLFEASQTQLATEMGQLRRSDELLKEQSIRDPLTGLYNRNHFNDVIRKELLAVRKGGLSLSVLVADVDRFKEINDRKGHAAGDDVLRFVANYLTSCVRESDYVFRWGGDEFLVLLPHTEEADAAQKAEDLGRSLPRIPGANQVQASLSVGWATHRSGREFPATLAEADGRMYNRKLSRGKKPGEPAPDLPLPS